MFKLLSAIIIVLSSANVFADDMPIEVQDMIKTMNNELIDGGSARESIKLSQLNNPYSVNSLEKLESPSVTVEDDYAEEKKQKEIAEREEKFKKAKFNLELKVISCIDDNSPDYLKETAKKHDACGSLEARYLFDDSVEIYLTRESRFDNLKPSKVMRTIPTIAKEGNNFIIKDQQISATVKLGTEVFVVPTTIIGRKVQLDIAVRTTELAEINEVYLDSNDKNFVNNNIALKNRLLVSSFPVAINKTEILGGNSAILTPMTSDFKAAKNYPETARLWLEAKLTLPTK